MDKQIKSTRNDTAFPIPGFNSDINDPQRAEWPIQGLSKLEYFSGQLMQASFGNTELIGGLIELGESSEKILETLVKASINAAKILIRELDKNRDV